MNSDEAQDRSTVPNTPGAVARHRATEMFDETDWLGCESLHPLTWLPSPVVAADEPPP